MRDNIYVAFAHHAIGASHIATEVVRALIAFFGRYRHRFDDIISGAVDPQDVANRPHVRFDGGTLSEIGDQRWAHAQNDALGYFLWLSSTLAASGDSDGGRGHHVGAHTPRALLRRHPLLAG